MSNSSMVVYTKLSPNYYGARKHALDTISIHCMACDATIESCGAGFANPSKKASSNYGIGSDGRVGLYVDEKNASMCTSNSANDHRAVTIEVACKPTYPYAVTDKAYNALIELCADICKRNGIKALKWSTNKNERMNHLNGCNMTVHRDFAAKACPGDYLYNRMADIANKVNAKLGSGTAAVTPPAPEKVVTSATGSYIVRITASTLNVRKGPGTNYAVATTVKKGQAYTIVETKNGWGKLKSGAGWISLAYTQRV